MAGFHGPRTQDRFALRFNFGGVEYSVRNCTKNYFFVLLCAVVQSVKCKVCYTPNHTLCDLECNSPFRTLHSCRDIRALRMEYPAVFLLLIRHQTLNV